MKGLDYFNLSKLENRIKLAKAMISPLRTGLDYTFNKAEIYSLYEEKKYNEIINLITNRNIKQIKNYLYDNNMRSTELDNFFKIQEL